MDDDFDRIHWPFRCRFYSQFGWTYCTDAESRLSCVRTMPIDALRSALDIPNLQKTVTQSIRRRLIQLEACA
jgi:hypothetical protein